MTAQTTNTAQLLNGAGGLYTAQGLGGKMPYKVVKTGSKFAVHKLDEDGNPTGKALGMHPDKAAADKQMRALYANEKKATKKELTTITLAPGTHIMGTTITDSDGNTSTVSKEIEVTEELDTKDYYGEELSYDYGYTGAISFAELEAEEEAQEAAIEVYNLTDNFTRLARCIMRRVDIEDKEAALSNLANEFIARVSSEVTESSEDKELALARQIAGDNQPAKIAADPTPEPTPDNKELFIWKEGSTYYCLLAYSNNRLDDEKEIISSESHKEFDQALSSGEWPMPELWLWHIPYPVGKVIHHAYSEDTGFPVALATFDKDKSHIAEAVMQSEDWSGVSHGMPDRWIERSKEDQSIIVRHRTKEVSILPHWAAANKAAFIINKEQSMTDLEKGLPSHKRPEFIKLLGEEQTKQIDEVLDKTSKELDRAGVVSKEVEPGPSLTKEDLVKGLEFVLTQVKEAVDGLSTRLEAIEKSQVKEADQFDIIEQLKAKSIIGKAAARVNGNSALAKDAPAEAEAEPGPTPVGLLNNLFAANEAWANKGGRR